MGSELTNLTFYHAKYFAHELTKRCASDSVEKLAAALSDAQVDLNPHQVEAALFAFRNPFSRGAIKLFVKLPDWFKVETPVGTYNPDWAIVKHEDQTIYLAKETKGTKDFLKLRTIESDKVRCGQKHVETLGVPFAVAVTANDV